MFNKSSLVYLPTLLCALIITPVQAAQRAFVASYGSDSNSCVILSPCRTFAQAMTVVDPNGEVVVLDSAGYGSVTLTQSVSLIAAPGIYAGIAVFPGTSGVTIAASVDVVLRGLAINSQNGNNGILMNGSSSLSIENCVISNFSGIGQHGIFVNSAASVRITDTLVRDNDTGIQLQGGAITDISNSKFLGNNTAILATSTTSPFTSVTISNSIVTAGGTGIEAISSGSGSSRISMIRSSVTNNLKGVASSATGGTAPVIFSDSMITGNVIGYFKGTGGTLTSLINNTITDNGSDTGPLGTTPLQ
ncbi:Right handed beta helix region [Candidatus Nitrotoga sp. HW29]|uniref:right-handed parallel beta-helix repeat-containing protein n=1 Tax=Candidatus Nitrotoga sp. HW29 TaxID=2886963 RepID=UPI001EF22BE9|nr:right-handed parallel beta-helix repeat-containing protein [Candidatus Nitrotoga sp. HW29]CAH1906361.1 Right handed beta helix region [Candidatus Nitrotoga sp. HW29]